MISSLDSLFTSHCKYLYFLACTIMKTVSGCESLSIIIHIAESCVADRLLKNFGCSWSFTQTFCSLDLMLSMWGTIKKYMVFVNLALTKHIMVLNMQCCLLSRTLVQKCQRLEEPAAYIFSVQQRSSHSHYFNSFCLFFVQGWAINFTGGQERVVRKCMIWNLLKGSL
jgi:hypothetical protein